MRRNRPHFRHREDPASSTDALEASLFEWNAFGRVGTRIVCTWIQSAATVGSSAARSAETSELTLTRFVFTHGAIVTCGGVATRFFVLTLKTGIVRGARAEVALFLVATSSAIVTRLRSAVQ